MLSVVWLPLAVVFGCSRVVFRGLRVGALSPNCVCVAFLVVCLSPLCYLCDRPFLVLLVWGVVFGAGGTLGPRGDRVGSLVGVVVGGLAGGLRGINCANRS